jgi:ATP-binding cassette subfamily B protein
MKKKTNAEKINKKNTGRAMRLLLSSVKQYKAASIWAGVFVLLEVLLEVFIPIVMAQIINVGMNAELTSFTFAFEAGKWSLPIFTVGDRTTYIVTCGVMMIGFALVSMVFGMLSGKISATAATGFGMNLRRDEFYKVEQFGFKNLDKFSTGGLITRLTTDVTNVQNAYMMTIRLLVRAPFMMVLAILMSVAISPDLSVIFAVALPVLILGVVLGVRVVFPRFDKMLKKYDEMNENTQENLIGIRAVKAYVREDYEIKRFEKVSGKVQELQFKAEKIMVIAMPFMMFIIFACIISIVWFGGNDIIKGRLGAGDLTAFLSYVMQIIMSFLMVATVLITLVLSRASAERIVEVLKEDADIKEMPSARTDAPDDGSIDFENVDFSYSNNTEVLNLENVNLHIESGETVGIIGGTGSAKTTLVQLIPRLYDVLEGEVKVGGVNVKNYALDTLRDSVGMVLQKNVLFSGTIKENLLWGNPEATDDEIRHAAEVAQAHDFISGFADGYQTELGQGGVNLSGGQKQRLCIARALLKKPKIMILDDSTSAVDTATDMSIRAGLKKEFGSITVLIIAQRIASVQEADKIIILENGKINAVGTHEQLLQSNQIYQEVYYSQQKGADNE